jgi:hypothetical protein
VRQSSSPAQHSHEPPRRPGVLAVGHGQSPSPAASDPHRLCVLGWRPAISLLGTPTEAFVALGVVQLKSYRAARLGIAAVIGVGSGCDRNCLMVIAGPGRGGEFAGQGLRCGVRMIIAANEREDLLSDLSPLAF